MMPNKSLISLLLLSIVAVAVWFLRPLAVTEHYGLWSLVPAAATIFICFVTRNVLFALLLGILAGGLISGQLNILEAFLIPSLGSEKYAQILLVYLWALGALLGMWNRNGGARYFAESMAKRFVNSRTSAKLFTWVMGLIFHQGGTISTVLTGTTVKPVADQHGVAHEELAYVVDSTASPAATIIPFNVWPVYVAGLITIEPLSALVTSEADALKLFFMAIPFNFYAWIAVAMTFLFALDRLPLLGTPMSKVVERVRNTGQLDRQGSSPMSSPELTELNLPSAYSPSILDFLLPIGTLMGFCIIPWLVGGSPWVFEGFGMAVVVSLVTSVARGMSLKTAFEAMVTGIKGVTIGAIVLGLAVTLANVSEQLGTAQYVIAATSETLAQFPYVLPSLLMFICMLVAFSIGSSWGTYAVVFPVALPLALVLSSDPTYILLCFGAILGGAVFGDQCSPISDTTILSSLACGSDLMDHVNTQLPLALIAATLSAVAYLVVSLIVL
jgi:Na+/H+ antiporter NhaC